MAVAVVAPTFLSKPVVAADSPGLRDSVRRDETGLLVPFGNDAALSDALVRVLTDAGLRRTMGQAGIAWARRFQWPDCGARSLDALTGGPLRARQESA